MTSPDHRHIPFRLDAITGITASETEVVAVGSTAVLILVATFGGSHGVV